MFSRFYSGPRGKKQTAARASRAAFTLIELLVVIAIIAILAAILFPVFAQAREKARQAACLSNTKQIALGIMQYTQDYDELLPVIGDSRQCRGRWQWQLYPYVKNGDVYTCPNLPDNKWNPTTSTISVVCDSSTGGSSSVTAGWASVSGYGWSGALAYDARGVPAKDVVPGWSLAEIKKPAETLIVGDVSFDKQAGYYMNAKNPELASRTGNLGTTPWYYANFRHNTTKTVPVVVGTTTYALPIAGRANFTFLDGHSKSLDLNTAFQESKDASGSYKEDGYTLATSEADDPASHYTLWNVY